MAKLLAAIAIGCHHYSFKNCPVPGFSGSDSSPSYDKVNDQVVVGSYDSNIYKINGTEPYSIISKIEGPGGEDSPSLLDSAWFGWGGLKGNEVFMYDLVSDAKLWSWSPGEGKITTSAADSVNNLCYVGTSNDSDGKFFALDCDNGSLVWEEEMGGEQWGTLGPGISPDGSMVCVGVGGDANLFKDVGSKLVCMNSLSGELLWQKDIGKQIQSRPSFGRDGRIYVGDYNGCVYSFDRENGSKVWERCFEGIAGVDWLTNVEGSTAYMAVEEKDELVFVTSFTGYLYALDGETGEIEWKVKLGKPYIFGGGAASTPLVDVDMQRVYVGGPEGIWAVDAITGDVAWHHETKTQCGSSPTSVKDAVAIACEDGYLYLLAK